MHAPSSHLRAIDFIKGQNVMIIIVDSVDQDQWSGYARNESTSNPVKGII